MFSLQLEYVSQNKIWCWYYEFLNLIHINLYFWQQIIKGNDILLSKLEFYGIRGKFNALIKSYLNNRHQRVSITSKNFCHSSFFKWRNVRCGVSQGSILGPLLFLLYINDLTRVFGNNHKPVLFTDDTSLIVTHLNYTDFSKDITSTFNKLNKWFAANLLTWNLKKKHNMYSLWQKTLLQGKYLLATIIRLFQTPWTQSSLD